MPGLVGIVSKEKVKKELLLRMTRSIKHYSNQRLEMYINSYFGLGRVHLGIFNAEKQPVFNDDRSLCIFMYGKIFNYEKEKKKLIGKYKFISNNDPEYSLHAFEEYGKDFVKKLNGAFNIVIFDFKKKELIIFNDRYGLRPLYYFKNDDKLIFASEAKAILQDKTYRRELNGEAVADFFAFGDIFGDKTFFKGIEVLSPGSILTFNRNGMSIEQYWDFHYKPDYEKSEDEFVDELIVVFKKAIRVRMEDDVRYGVALSGGLDSRTVLGAIDRDKRKDTVTITFGVPGCNEGKIAKSVSFTAGSKHIFLPIDPDEVLTPYTEKVVYFTEGAIPIHISHQVFIYEKLIRYVDVLFDGLALDLSLGGSFLRTEVFKIQNDQDLFKMINTRRRFPDAMLVKLFKDEFYKMIKDIHYKSIKDVSKLGSGHPCNRYDKIALTNHVRRFTISAGNNVALNYVEQIPPTYDNDFIDLILTIPPELRFQHRIYKKFLKKLSPELSRITYSSTMVPPMSPFILWKLGKLYRSGKGRLEVLFWKMSKGKLYIRNNRSYAPMDEWLRANDNWKRYTRDILLDQNALLINYCNQDFINKIIREHESGEKNHFHRINYLITFELFLQSFFSDVKRD